MYQLSEIIQVLKDDNDYIVYCFGKSVFSQMIMAMTKIRDSEEVPSHILIKSDDMIMEASTDAFKIDSRSIPNGVRYYTVDDFIKNELSKKTLYRLKKIKLNSTQKKRFLQIMHSGYSYKTIEDFLFGRHIRRIGTFICSGVVEYILTKLNIYPLRQPSPADIYREHGYDEI